MQPSTLIRILIVGHWSHKVRAHLDTPPLALGGELTNGTGDTIAQVADQVHRGTRWVCDSETLVVGFLAHTGPSLNDEPSL